ncbi:HAD-IA family hydrolase [Paraburkholderia bonniea]|nr:HAD-IA family hydrolase [Paraburkholderia bonniea]WJF90990.1 HAD-IA family hydrolase [Paraburkholderia bonniea]WJF94304.1 HAD-IA family hydrolase [Paraburkholderia bonniea]
MSYPSTLQPSDTIPSQSQERYQAVLFDLDGTLADTAPDLAAAVNKLRQRRGLDLLPLEVLRPLASAGARGLIGEAFGITPEHAEFAAMRDEFLANYAADICVESALFPGIHALLDNLDTRGIRWGIVTNKVARLTQPLAALLGLDTRTGCIVSGDTTAHAKPHPAPLLYAADALGVAPEHILYVGDDLRDIQAGHAAAMATVAAAYGYCGDGLAPEAWQARFLVRSPAELQALLRDITYPG